MTSEREAQATAELLTAVHHDDVDAVRRALRDGADPGVRDSDGWNALDHAAGRGSVASVIELLASGADPTATGPDLRTPYQIALAANQRATAIRLRSAQEAADPSSTPDHVWTPYCRAYPIAELRRFSGWRMSWEDEAAGDHEPEGQELEGQELEGQELEGPDLLREAGVVFVHDDLRVTRSMWRDTGIVFDGQATGWAEFCSQQLAFRVPDDLDLLPAGPDLPS